MTPRFCLRARRTALPLHPGAESAAPQAALPASLKRLLLAATLLTLAALAQRAVQAQQGWAQQGPGQQGPAQNQPYAGSQYVQPNPNYVGYPAKPTPYQYPQQSAPGQQYAQYPQQPQQDQGAYQDPGAGSNGQRAYGQDAYGQGAYGQGANGQDSYQDDPQYSQQPQQPAQGFAAEQLEQLVAPIALYPDSLVAQILAASTYPAQVAAADGWLHSQAFSSADQVAYAADAQTNWDPSVKALSAFPAVLDLMNHDLQWTTDLGNAYYNQPQDVLQTIQVMRQRAQSAGTLQSTPEENVSYNQGYIQVAPANPAEVYVPSYNPWGVYGQQVSPYPGFSLTGALQSLGGSNFLRYGLSFAMSAFSHTPFGWAGWALNWLTSNVLFHQSPYYSQSTSVAHWGGYGSHGGGLINRTPNGYGVARGGLNRTPNGYGVARGGEFNRTPNGYARPEQSFNRGYGYGQPGFDRQPQRAPQNYAYNRGTYNRDFERPGETPYRSYGDNVRPALGGYGYNRPQAPIAQPVRPQAFGRPGGYGNGFYSGSQPGYGQRSMNPYAGGQAFRAPAQSYQRNNFSQRAYAEPKFSQPKQQHFGGGSHFFGGGHGEQHYKAPKMQKAPRMSGGGHHSGGGHGGSFFGHHGR